MMNVEHIAFEIEARAKAMGLSIEELCRRAGKAPTTFRRIRRGEVSPTFATMEKFTKALEEVESARGIAAQNSVAEAHGEALYTARQWPFITPAERLAVWESARRSWTHAAEDVLQEIEQGRDEADRPLPSLYPE